MRVFAFGPAAAERREGRGVDGAALAEVVERRLELFVRRLERGLRVLHRHVHVHLRVCSLSSQKAPSRLYRYRISRSNARWKALKDLLASMELLEIPHYSDHNNAFYFQTFADDSKIFARRPLF